MSLYRRLHERFGSAGVVIAVIALVAALGGTAFAAKGTLTGKQKKEVQRIAKRFAGERGPQGHPGPQGVPGPQGSPGVNGTNGKDGADGASVDVSAYAGAECEAAAGEEGAKLSVGGKVVYVCNGGEGAPGSPWTAGGTLPTGSTETGVWSVMGTGECCGGVKGKGEEQAAIPLSFNVPLPSPLDNDHVHFFEMGQTPGADSGCSGGTPAAPTADPGHLCVYTALGPAGTSQSIRNPATEGAFGASTSGAYLELRGLDNTMAAHGTWAVKAP